MNSLDAEVRDALIAALREEPRSSYREISARLSVSQNTIIAWNHRLRADKCKCGAAIHSGECGGHARVTPELRAAMIAERVDFDASTADIAMKFNVHVAVAYRELMGHPVRVRRKAPDSHTWTAAEDARLRPMWEGSPRRDIVAAFPNRTWHAIQSHAKNIGAKRHPVLRRRVEHDAIHPVIQQLNEARWAQDVTVKDLARRAGIDNRNLTGYELGNNGPSFDQVIRWARALGFELTLAKAEASLEGRPTITPHVYHEPPPFSASRNATQTLCTDPPEPTPRPRPQVGPLPPLSRPRPAASTVSAVRKSEEDAIAEFLTKKGVTRLPPTGDPALAELPPMVFDKHTRKYTRRLDAEGVNTWTKSGS